MSFSITNEGTHRLIARFDSMSDVVRQRIAGAMQSEVEALQQAALDRMSELFKNGGGAMRSSLSTSVYGDGSTVTGNLFAFGLPYLRIQEYGGVTRPHEILPRNASVLAFAMPGAAAFKSGSTSGDTVFAKSVQHPGSRMPERSFLRYALETRRNAIRDAFQAAAWDGVRLG
jgi:hypothetical protein